MKLFKLSEEAVKTLSVEQIAVLAVLANTPRKDYTASFYCYEDYVADKLGYSTRQIERIMRTLKASNLFTVEHERVKGCKEYRNRYSFPALDTKFILVKANIFDLGLEVEEIGTLIKFKALTFYNGLTINKAKDWIGKACGMGKTRFNRILSSLQGKGLVNYEASKLTITCDLFKDNKGKVRVTKETRECIKALNEILISHINNFNSKSQKYKITDLSDKNVNILLSRGLERLVAIYARTLYRDKQFTGIRNINNYISFLTYGVKYQKPVEKERLIFIMP